MIQETPTLGKSIGKEFPGKLFRDPTANVRFPILELQLVEKRREEHQVLLKRLFPKPIRLSRLISDIENNFTKEIASIIGSVDFAKDRLAGLISALRELEQKITRTSYIDLKEVRERIQQDSRIHQSLEDLVFESARFTLEES